MFILSYVLPNTKTKQNILYFYSNQILVSMASPTLLLHIARDSIFSLKGGGLFPLYGSPPRVSALN